MVYWRENPMKMDDDWGYPHVWKPNIVSPDDQSAINQPSVINFRSTTMLKTYSFMFFFFFVEYDEYDPSRSWWPHHLSCVNKKAQHFPWFISSSFNPSPVEVYFLGPIASYHIKTWWTIEWGSPGHHGFHDAIMVFRAHGHSWLSHIWLYQSFRNLPYGYRWTDVALEAMAQS